MHAVYWVGNTCGSCGLAVAPVTAQERTCVTLPNNNPINRRQIVSMCLSIVCSLSQYAASERQAS